mmetsp:Transcript_7157/g.20973  ORF Transcript_7157/g.20973 Transcript_7157/m.20973 type:complete len:250 (+) Transcript_7157:2055-2804(+)
MGSYPEGRRNPSHRCRQTCPAGLATRKCHLCGGSSHCEGAPRQQSVVEHSADLVAAHLRALQGGGVSASAVFKGQGQQRLGTTRGLHRHHHRLVPAHHPPPCIAPEVGLDEDAVGGATGEGSHVAAHHHAVRRRQRPVHRGHLDGGAGDVGAVNPGHQLPVAAQVQVELQRVGALVVHHRRRHLRPAFVHQHRLDLVPSLAPGVAELVGGGQGECVVAAADGSVQCIPLDAGPQRASPGRHHLQRLRPP